MATVERKCKNCKESFTARTADVKRGWAKFCCKSCKAKWQTRKQWRGVENIISQPEFTGQWEV